MTDKTTIADLLALRDGEPLSADTRAAIAADAEAPARLEQLMQIRAALRDLPEEQPDPQLFERIQAQLEQRQIDRDPQVTPLFAAPAKAKAWRLRYPLATAASVFMLAIVGSLLWLPKVSEGPEGPVAGPTPVVASNDAGAEPRLDMAALMDRSQQLEAVARLPVAKTSGAPEPSRQALLYRIADLDAELNALIEEEPMNPELKEKLWRQRVQLLETLVAIQQEQMADAAGLY